MKVFHVITSLDLGGAERVAVNIVSSLTKDIEYHIVEVVKGRGEFTCSLLQELQNKGIKYHRSVVRNKKLSIILFPFLFILLFLKYRPKIIHTHTEIPDLSIYLFHLIFGFLDRSVLYVRTIHNTQLWNEWGSIGGIVERFFIKKRANIAISLSTQQSYYERFGELTPIIYNGVKCVYQKEFDNIVKGKTNVLFAGRLEVQKGIRELIETVKRMNGNDEVVFHIVGNGSLRSLVEKELKNGNNVYLYDKIYGLSSYLSSFDYLFMPSNFEGLGLMSIEASFARTPCIINSCLGLNETLPEDWPMKVENNDVNEYEKIFKERIFNIDRKTLGDMAYNYVVQKFTIKKMQQEYEQFYRQGYGG